MRFLKVRYLVVVSLFILIFIYYLLASGTEVTRYKGPYGMLRKMRDDVKYNLKVIWIELSTPEENLSTTKLPVYSIWVKPEKLDILNSNLPLSGRNYVEGEFEYMGRWYPVEVRYRGDMPWHWGSRQKSWRIRFPRNNLFNGRRDVNLNNPEREVIDEALESWLAKEMGLLTPQCSVVHVRLNNMYLGVFLDFENIDEYFLKSHHKKAANIYSGEQDILPYEKYINMWKSTARWIKKASNDNKPQNDISDLYEFIRTINSLEGLDFKAEIQKIIDLENVLTYMALVDICSSEHIDNTHNLKLYFPAATGRLQQIPWDISGHWTDEGAESTFNRKKNDFWLKLLSISEFREQKNKILWKYINGVASVSSQINFVDEMYELIRNDIYCDKYKDTYLLEPMTNGDFEKRVKKLRDWIKKRNKALTDVLDCSKLYVIDKSQNITDERILKKLEFIAINESGVLIKFIEIPLGPAASKEVEFELWYDENRNGVWDRDDRLLSTSKEFIHFKVMRVLLSGSEAVEPPGFTRADYKWISRIPKVVPTSFNFFITLSHNDEAAGEFGLSLGKLRRDYITAENSITSKATEVIVSSQEYDGFSRGRKSKIALYQRSCP